MSAKLFWITGLSGSGKTTLAKLLLQKLNAKKDRKTILIDGDVIREIFGNQSDYSRQARLNTAWHYAKLAQFLVQQDLNVICSTISLFHEIHDWNRKNIPGYFEVFLDVGLDELKKRDSKKIYSRAEKGELKDVVGIDIKAEFPRRSDIILYNIAYNELEKYANIIVKKCYEKL